MVAPLAISYNPEKGKRHIYGPALHVILQQRRVKGFLHDQSNAHHIDASQPHNACARMHQIPTTNTLQHLNPPLALLSGSISFKAPELEALHTPFRCRVNLATRQKNLYRYAEEDPQ